MKRIKVFLAVLFCRCVRLAAKLVGRGSSIPGLITLKLFPGILGDIEMPKLVIAVTGSNGKTSTVEMIHKVLLDGGLTVACNSEGSNQTEGVATCILANCSLSGKVKTDVVLLESDEQYAQHTFKYFQPDYFFITNLYRDQLTRNGHPEWIANVISRSFSDKMTLVLNRDDPLVSSLGEGREKVIYFGADHLNGDKTVNTSIYNDGSYCPICKHPLKYDYYHYNHIGSYHCDNCGFKRNKTDYTLTAADFDEGYIVINEQYRINLAFKGIYHCYNTLAAFTAGAIAGVSPESAVKTLNNYNMTSGRVQKVVFGGREGTLLASKHENSISYDRSIDVAIADKNRPDVMIIVDAISRKYFTSETSWLWDIDFENLNNENIGNIVLAGRYCYDLAARFEYTGIPAEKIQVFESIPARADWLKQDREHPFYVITCFADSGKVLALSEIKGVRL